MGAELGSSPAKRGKETAEGGGGGGSKGAATAAPSTVPDQQCTALGGALRSIRDRAVPLPHRSAMGEEPDGFDSPGGTVAEALSDARARLAAAGIESAALDARLLLEAATGLTTARLLADGREPLDEAAARRFAAMVERRLRREPVARILGEREFWGLPIGLNAATLVPRPETEIVVEAALDAVRHFHPGRPIHICDLGTGSGAILIALLSELPQARGTGIDVSARALAQARSNAERLGVGKRVRFRVGDFAGPQAGSYDLVVSNPPYVPSADLTGLAPEVRDHDPPQALDGGADGLDAYRTIACRLPALLAGDGTAVLELGAGQAEMVAALIDGNGFRTCEVRRDLAGIERALVARLHPIA